MSSKKNVTTIISLILFGFLFYTACFGVFSSHIQRTVPFALASILLFITRPITKASGWKGSLLRIVDYLLILASLGTVIYLILQYESIAENVGLETPAVITVGILGTVVALEICRRSVGLPLTLIAVFFLVYDHVGYIFPGVLGHAGISVARIVRLTFLSSGDGVFGVALGVMISVIFYFTVMGGVLHAIGAGKFFIDLAMALVGKYRSGPALSAVVGSALFGMISGSAPANAVTVGVVTIPLMKSRGYSPRFAGGVEAVSSSGGQIMPPVMGAAAFVMAEILGVPYLQVCLWAALPAFLYFLCCGMSVHTESIRLGLKGLKAEQRETVSAVLRRDWYLILPILVLLGLMALDLSLSRCAFWSTLSAIIIGFFRKEVRGNPRVIYDGIMDGVRQSLPIFAACAVVGITIVSITMVGLGTKLSIAILLVAGKSLLLNLVLTMIVSLILGMGLPTLAAYLLLATIMGPTLVQLGMMPPVAHLFIFYFSIISAITPPVALAAYAAAAIAGADPVKVGFTAFRIGLVTFIVPFMFAYNPAFLLIGSVFEVIKAVGTAIVGIVSLSMALSGYGLRRMVWIERIVLGIAAILLIQSGLILDLLGIVLFLAILSLQTERFSNLLRKPEGGVR